MSEIKKLKFCINNEWRDTTSGEYMDITNSSTGEVMAKTPKCTKDEVEEAVQAAKDAYPGWSNTPIQKRVEVMFKFKNKIEEHLDELAKLVATEHGKNLAESRGDVIKALEVVEASCSTPYLMQGDSIMNISNGFDTVMYREPLGVFAGIVPMNFPAMIPFGWMLPFCVTTGNTFVLKAASQVPQTGMRMLELLIEAGLPKGVVNIVTCSRHEAEILLKHPDIKGISYVGSSSVGKHIYSTAAAHGKRVQALGEAKNHALILKDAMLERVAAAVRNSAFGCAGQRCMALPVVCVEEDIADDFVKEIVKSAKELKIGPAYDPETDLGPVISEEHKKSVSDWIEKGLEEGAELILDGRDVKVEGHENGFYLGPTILDHVTEDMSVGRDEIFGPVLCIKRVKDFEEGLKIMNNSPFANGSSIFTQSGYYAREFSYRTHGGMVGVNVGIPVPASYFPFSGHKESFYGDLHVMGKDGIAFFTESKCVTSRWFNEEDRKNTNVGTWEGTITRE
ncbi:CoA-acylating methylmalonate-semialdehyde dehydrogenase [Natranaerofaba carboxydovora]|uniref:CoA-acylating methylmalonate-semialdehyde dehydrogenase n=1 Tax=Natranaerofaba carboxydovora TaxID=2742683 RepID=UPI001F14867B|nr:CoA-acylating methylmalonate-semialdehyde dehydrogenase [Natranaerofaba carboxydovora]UMZ72678.1 Methylmalonate semialdehyde dehydrogenase [acylating] [Natranaerofaba carboxydovora]